MMRVYRIAVVLGLTLLVAGWRPVSAQTAGPPPPLGQSLQAISRLMARVPNASVSVNFAEFKVRLATSKLQELAATWPAEPPVEYRANVSRQALALEQSLGAGNVETLTKVLEAVASDLNVKLEHAQKGGPPAVMLHVRMTMPGQDAGNSQVLYRIQSLDAAGDKAEERLLQAAGPAPATFVPGRYVIWARDSRTGAVGEPKPMTVGEGLPDVALELPGPAPAR
jgi:hypothetical protein